MKLRNVVLGIALVVLLHRPLSAGSFTDDFNRPDAPTLGNGWQNVSTNGQPFQLIGNRAVFPYSAAGGFYRQTDNADTVQVGATFTDVNGFGGLLDRYGTVGFSVFGDGTLGSGYEVDFYRGDQNYNDSQVSLSDNHVILGTIFSSFQFGPSITTAAIFSKTAGVTGTITDGVNTFDFTFGPYSTVSTGTNTLFFAAGPDTRSPLLTYPTIDNVSITTGVDFPNSPPTNVPDSGNMLLLLGLAFTILGIAKLSRTERPGELHGLRLESHGAQVGDTAAKE